MNELLVEGLPHSREAEEAVLGACIINPEVLPLVAGIITHPDDFYLIRNRLVWNSLNSLSRKHEPIDYLTIQVELGDKLMDVGGPAYITTLVSQCPTSLNAESYAREVHRSGIKRRLISAAGEIANAAINFSVEEAVTRSLEAVHLASNGLIGGRGQDAEQLIAEHYERVTILANQDETPGIPTGYMDLDLKLGGGLQNGDFILLAAFPGGGKTSLLDCIAAHVAKTRFVDLYTLEMSNMSQTNRILAQMSGINSQVLRSGKLAVSEWPLYDAARHEFEKLRLRIDDTTPLSVPTLRAKCVQHKAMGELDLVLVDYAGLMHSLGSSEYEQNRTLSRDLKLLAGELNVPVMAAHQLNRKAHERAKPTMFDLRGSGTWEQDADIVMLVYEPTDEDRPMTQNGFEDRILEVVKQRNGPTGIIELLFKNETTRFESSTGRNIND